MERIKDIIDTSVNAGRIMPEHGSEIYRCEDTIVRIANCLGIKNLNIFTLSTCIFVTCEENDESYTCIRRLAVKRTDLTKISKVNQLSRDLSNHNMDLETINQKLKEIEEGNQENKLITAISMSIACGLFGLMITSSGLGEFLSIIVITFISYFCLDHLSSKKCNVLLKNVLISMLITIFSILCLNLSLIKSIDDVIIGSIMLLVPGVAITNAIRDAMSGDILSGTIRLVEAMTIALGIAVGVGLILFFYLYV